MDSPQTFIAFGTVMLVIALLGVVVDWFGKPMRHRKFVPKIYRFPSERQPRHSKVRQTPWSDTAFVLPVAEPSPDELIVRYPDTRPQTGELFDRAALPGPAEEPGPPTVQVPPVHPQEFHAEPIVEIVTVEEHQAKAATETPTPEVGHRWHPGGHVFSLTANGHEPSPATVRTRYWKNVAATTGAAMFGEDNVQRMQSGKPPQRRNPRTTRLETMRLPQAATERTGGPTPIPEWPSSELDPFS